MQTLALFALASRQANWLDAREATIASNVANANTPGYEARDLAPFDSVMSNLPLSMAATSPGHIQPVSESGETVKVKPQESWDVVYSGNSVNPEQEMMKAGDVSRSHALNVNIVRSFQQMLMNAVKS
jgi:flagellar basal-body rod protein FlgB